MAFLKKIYLYTFILFIFQFLSCGHNSDYYLKNGLAKYELADYEGSIKEFDSAINIDENKLAAYYWKGVCLFNLKNYQSSLAHCNKIIRIASEKIDSDEYFVIRAYGLRAHNKQALEDYYGSIKDYTSAIELNSLEVIYRPVYYYERGRAKALIRDYEGAINDFTDASSLKYGYGDAYFLRGSIYYRFGNKNLACKDFLRAKVFGSTLLTPAVLDVINTFCN